jgi:L-2-hydroxyglutarate oxidase LhgO
MSEAVETLVVGAGVIGLAVARRLALAGHEVLVIDEAPDFGSQTSARNSEVIHAGIYYEPGSLKARLCVAGKKALYAYARDAGIAAKPIGKLIVATSTDEVPRLHALNATARQNGVDDLELLDAAAARVLEPDLHCVAALHSPSTSIIDSRAYMLALLGEAEAHGATLALETRFVAAKHEDRRFAITLADATGAPFPLACRNLVNCAGHGAHDAARAIDGHDTARLPPRFLAKGTYCAVTGRSPFRHLIYPIPVRGALGIHLTLLLDGAARLGPDIEWVEDLDYAPSADIAPRFADACQAFWPGIVDREITPSYCGIRPKIHGPDRAFADFVIAGPQAHGVAGLVNLFGIESPGLTSSLAIADTVAECLGALPERRI